MPKLLIFRSALSCLLLIVALASLQELTLFLKPRQSNNHVRPCHPSPQELCPIASSPISFTSGGGEIRDLSWETPLCHPQSNSHLYCHHSSISSCQCAPTPTHVKIMTKGGRKRKFDRMADFHGVALVSSSQGRQASRRPLSAKSALRRALPLQTAWTTLLRRANTCAMQVCEEGHRSNCPDNRTALNKL